jgi:hypothetical protein
VWPTILQHFKLSGHDSPSFQSLSKAPIFRPRPCLRGWTM